MVPINIRLVSALSFICVGVLTTGFAVAASRNPDHQDTSLKGIKSFQVIAFARDSEGKSIPLVEPLQSVMVEDLNNSGITAGSAFDHSFKPDPPVESLIITMVVFRGMGGAKDSFVLRVRLLQTVTLERNPKTRLYLATWEHQIERSAVDDLPAASGAAVHSATKALIEAFKKRNP